MRYWRSYQFVFISPKWLTNLVAGIVCMFVPILGPIVLLGYQFEMIEAMLRDGEENYPDFDMNRVMNYLWRGAWPFIIQLVASLPLILIIIVSYFVFIAAMVTSAGDPGIWVYLLFGGLLIAAIVFGSVILPLLILPLELRAGLSKNLRAAFSREFYFDLIRRCWKELIVAQLFIFASGFLLGLVGLLLCGLGTAPAQALTMFARSHLMYQIYNRYLEKGGVPPAVQEVSVQA